MVFVEGHLVDAKVSFWLSSRKGLPDAPPGGEGHDTVVDHMQGGQMAELLAQQKEDGVQIVHVLAEEVPPRHVQSIEPILHNFQNWFYACLLIIEEGRAASKSSH
jgi:hypothetical protein